MSDHFTVTESRDHQPNENRIAFWAGSVETVDELTQILIQAGAKSIEGPDDEADYYCAVFFEDPCGNRFELCYRTQN